VLDGARERLLRITLLLEGRYGVPEHVGRGDLIGALVATILSQNTSDVNSKRAYAGLREGFSSWDEVACAHSATIEEAIRRGGLARTKSVRIRRILNEILESTGKLDLEFLRDRDSDEVLSYLERFHGVGKKTAACVVLFELGRDVLPVDTHVHRVISRLGILSPDGTAEAVYAGLKAVAPRGKALSLHVNMIRLGREFCRPRGPGCDRCPLAPECDHADRNRPIERS